MFSFTNCYQFASIKIKKLEHYSTNNLSPDFSLICPPTIITRGESGVLPVKTSKEVTWSTAMWTVLDKSELQLFEHSCQTPCLEQMFSFNVDTAGFHTYIIMVVDMEGTEWQCENLLAVLGTYHVNLLVV